MKRDLRTLASQLQGVCLPSQPVRRLVGFEVLEISNACGTADDSVQVVLGFWFWLRGVASRPRGLSK